MKKYKYILLAIVAMFIVANMVDSTVSVSLLCADGTTKNAVVRLAADSGIVSLVGKNKTVTFNFSDHPGMAVIAKIPAGTYDMYLDGVLVDTVKFTPYNMCQKNKLP